MGRWAGWTGVIAIFALRFGFGVDFWPSIVVGVVIAIAGGFVEGARGAFAEAVGAGDDDACTEAAARAPEAGRDRTNGNDSDRRARRYEPDQ